MFGFAIIVASLHFQIQDPRPDGLQQTMRDLGHAKAREKLNHFFAIEISALNRVIVEKANQRIDTETSKPVPDLDIVNSWTKLRGDAQQSLLEYAAVLKKYPELENRIRERMKEMKDEK